MKYKVPVVLWGIAAWELVAVVVAAAADWPAQFGTDGSAPEGALQWLVKGSALSAPLVFLVAIVVVGFLATRDGRVGMVGDVLAVVIAAFTLVASLGEALAPDPVTAPRGVLVVSGLLGLVFAGLIAWSVLHDIRGRRSAGGA